MRYIRKKYVWACIYMLLITMFTLYVVLDTFVIARVYTTVPSDESKSTAETSASPESASAQDTGDDSETVIGDTGTPEASSSAGSEVITENSYSDGNISITITEYREYDSTIYVADVCLSSAEYLKTALAENSYGKNITEKTSELARDNNAILAINGDYYGAQEECYVLRNGVLYRDRSSDGREDLVIWADGSFEIVTEGEVSAQALLDAGAIQVLSFGPALVEQGTVAVSKREEVGKAMASNPRTAIGIVDDLHYLFVVSDGRTNESKGLTLYQLAEFMQSLGCETAYNLDGGGSSTMYFNGEIINNPTTNGKTIKERSVSDIVYIGY